MYWFILPFMFAFLDRLRGTESTLYIGRLRMGYSMFYSLAVGFVVGIMAGECTMLTVPYGTHSWFGIPMENLAAGALATIAFFVGETRNWQEKGYYLQGSHKLATIFELIFRGVLWYTPVYLVLYFYDFLSLYLTLGISLFSGIMFWLSIHLSEYLWYNYGDKLKIDYKYFYINNAWTLDEALRGFIFGATLVVLKLLET